MSTWRPQHCRTTASRHTLAILDEVETKLVAFGAARPRVASVRIGADLRDQHDFEVEVELAPATTPAVRYQSVDDDDRDPHALEDEAGAVAWLVVRSVEQCHAFGTGVLADMLHDLRMRTRRTLAQWWGEGTHVELGDVRLVRTKYSGCDEASASEVRLRCLDDSMRPTIASIEVDDPDGIERVLARWRPRQGALFAARAALARQGADGTVDQLVLNAIAQHGNVATALRVIASGRRLALPQALTVFTYDGHVQCHGWDVGNDDYRWNRDVFTMHEQRVPMTTLLALAGQPVRALVEHPVLTDDMSILRAWVVVEDDEPSVKVELRQPRRLFCGASGRVWLPDAG